MNRNHEDPRFYFGEVRLHKYLQILLGAGGYELQIRHPDRKVVPARFCRSAFPVLLELGFAALVKKVECIPSWLDEKETKIASRSGQLPMWMLTTVPGEVNIWDAVLPRLALDKVLSGWPTKMSFPNETRH